jgi:hypothetical protein
VLKNFTFYETSYFWFVKRFYNFNNLSTNVFSFNLTNKLNSPIQAKTLESTYDLKISSLLRTTSLVNFNFNNFTPSVQNSTNGSNIKTSNTFKDLLNIQYDSDLLSIQDEEVLAVLNISSTQKNIFYYFSSINESSEFETNFNFNELTNENKKVNLFNLKTSQDRIFLNDLNSLFKLF